MDHRRHDDIDGWLRAESEGRDEDADALFAVVFAGRVPRLRPSPGMAERVITALGAVPPAVTVRPMPRWGRAATLVLLVAGGLTAAAVCSTWLLELLRAGWKLGPPLAVEAAALAVGALNAFVRACSDAVAVARALALVAASGPATAVLAANLLVAFIASMALKRVLSLEEESS